MGPGELITEINRNCKLHTIALLANHISNINYIPKACGTDESFNFVKRIIRLSRFDVPCRAQQLLKRLRLQMKQKICSNRKGSHRYTRRQWDRNFASRCPTLGDFEILKAQFPSCNSKHTHMRLQPIDNRCEFPVIIDHYQDP